MIYGKISGTFELLTEETAIKWKLPKPSAVADTFTAGRVANLSSSTGLLVVPALANMAARTAGGSMMLTGVLFDNYTSSLDESQGSGFITAIVSPHVGKTSQIATDITSSSVAGIPLYANTSGQFLSTNPGTAIPCAYLISCDGAFATYLWLGI